MFLKKVLVMFGFAVTVFGAGERSTLQYDRPAAESSGAKKSKKNAYIQEALPLGNGRLGAMFSGGIDREHLLLNEISLWMNSKRGLDPEAQSGTRIGAYKDLETVRTAYREG